MSAVQEGTAAKTETASAYRWYVLVLLTIVYTFNFIDRQIVGIISPALKADLGLADWQLGLLKGFAFAVLYTTLGIPIARLADRANRVTIISISLAVWSGFTAISGAAQSFVQLAMARVGVGIGEAGGSPPAHSLISDYFPKEKRAGALAFYAMGIPVGIAFAYLAGGWLTQTFGWRVAFVVVGLPGVLAALILKLTVREPERGAFEDGKAADQFARTDDQPHSFSAIMASEFSTVWQAAKHLLAIPTYRNVVIATTAISFSTYASGTWVVDFYSRTHAAFPILQVYFWMGIINGTAYVAGTYLGGFLVDKFSVKNKAMYGLIPALALVLNAPLYFLTLWVESPVLSLFFQFPVHMAVGFYLGPAFALAQTLAPVSIRALSTAIFFFILNMIALGFGPTTAGVLSSVLSTSMGEDLGLRVALTLVSLSGLIGAFFFYRVSKTIPADWAKATGETT